MVTITYSPVKSKLVCSSTAEKSHLFPVIDKALSFYKDGYFFSPKYQMHVWDGKTHFFSVVTGRFYSGFIGRVLKIIREEGYKSEVVGYPELNPAYDNTPPIELLNGDSTITLYEDQQNAVLQAARYSRGIWNMATNSGKTEVSAGLIKLLDIPPTLYLIPRSTLLKQTVARLEKRLGVEVGMVGGNTYRPNPNGVTVSMFQTANLRLKQDKKLPFVKRAEIILVDECQFLSDERYQSVVTACPAPVRILMSGTTSRADPVSKGATIGYGGQVLATVSNDDLVRAGRSAKPNILYIEPDVPMALKMRLLMNKDDYRGALQGCIPRHKACAAMARAFAAFDLQTMVMVAETKHGERIHEFIPEATLTHSTASNRRDTERRLLSGETFVCVTTPIFDTGFDTPHIGAIVYAGGGNDDIRLAQSLGRLLRQDSTGNKQPWFVDFLDNFHPILRRHSSHRYKYFKKHKTFTLTEDYSLLPPAVYTRFMQELSGMKG